jgi:hypothetical protein
MISRRGRLGQSRCLSHLGVARVSSQACSIARATEALNMFKCEQTPTGEYGLECF